MLERKNNGSTSEGEFQNLFVKDTTGKSINKRR
jgi:hypothetical protein